jgi:CRP/FNR family transcriptional regulator, cAMP and macrophage regulator
MSGDDRRGTDPPWWDGESVPGRPVGSHATASAAAWVAHRLGGGRMGALSATDLAALGAALLSYTLRPGQLVRDPARCPDGVSIIRRGAVEQSMDVGGQRLVVAVLREGDVFGEIPVLADEAVPCTVRVLSPTSCLLLPQSALTGLLARHPAITRLWLTGLATRFGAMRLRLLGTYPGPLPRRVARLLLDEMRDGQITLTQSTLAAMLGAARPSLNRVLQRFETEKLISLAYRRVTVLDRDRLAAMADGECRTAAPNPRPRHADR